MKKSEEITTADVVTALEKVPAGGHEVRYFNGPLIDKIEEMAETAAKHQAVAFILAGKTAEEAARLAGDAVIPLCFHLGLLVGQEMEATDAFRQMMVGGGFDGPTTDAGDTEHGGE